MMGTLLTEGTHLWVDRTSDNWKEIMMHLIDEIWKDHEYMKTDALYFRDFKTDDIEMRDYLIDRGFIKINMPNTNSIDLLNWDTAAGFLQQLPQKKRNRLKREIIRFQDLFEVRIINNATDDEIEYWYTLYQNVQKNSFKVNTFLLPKKLFYEASKNENIDIIELKLKAEVDTRMQRQPVAIGFVYKSQNNYCPWILGLDYGFKEYHVYRQLLFQAILRAKQLNKQKIYFGLTADEEKEKFGAKSTQMVAYIQVKDSFNLSVINLMQTNKAPD
jgi:hypothetical protein